MENYINDKKRVLKVSLSLITLHLASLIPISGSGSLFDIVFLPIIFILFIFSKKTIFNCVLITTYISLFILCILGTNNFDLILRVQWMIRLVLPFYLLSIFKNENEFNYLKIGANNKNKILFNFNLYFLLLAIFSLLSLINIISPRYYGLGFPIYSLGLDRHMFLPALAYLTVFMFHTLLNQPSAIFIKNKKFIQFSIIFTFLLSLIMGSRGSVFVYFLYLIYNSLFFIFNFLNKNFDNKIRFSRNNIKILLFLFFSISFIGFIIGYILFSYFPSDQFDFNRIERTFDFTLNLTSDPSRGDVFKTLIDLFRNLGSYFLPQENFITSVDLGLLLIINNLGILGFLIISSVWIYSLKILKKNSISTFIVFSSFCYLMINSPHIMIPRFWLLLIVPIILRL